MIVDRARISVIAGGGVICKPATRSGNADGAFANIRAAGTNDVSADAGAVLAGITAGANVVVTACGAVGDVRMNATAHGIAGVRGAGIVVVAIQSAGSSLAHAAGANVAGGASIAVAARSRVVHIKACAGSGIAEIIRAWVSVGTIFRCAAAGAAGAYIIDRAWVSVVAGS